MICEEGATACEIEGGRLCLGGWLGVGRLAIIGIVIAGSALASYDAGEAAYSAVASAAGVEACAVFDGRFFEG